MKRLATQADSVVPNPRQRIQTVTVILLIWMAVIGLRLLYLQTVQYEFLSEYARTQQGEMVRIPARRGRVVDRTGRDLAISVSTRSFYAIPDQIKDMEDAASRICRILGDDEQNLLKRLESARRTGRKFLWIARRVEDVKADKIEALRLSGLRTIKETRRRYPNNQLAAHALGFVGAEQNGQAGIESVYNRDLTGKEGKIIAEVDGRRHSFNRYELEPTEGKTVVLTIDETIQYFAERALQNAIKRTRAKAATAIVLDPSNGELLALANTPTFDPNEANRISPAITVNRALQHIYEPGSTFKIVSYSAALEEKLIRPEDSINCQPGVIQVGGRLIHDSHPMAQVSVTEALAKSSNVAAIKLGLRVGESNFFNYIRKFGFGHKTGIELPGESAGLLRPLSKWKPSSIGSIAIGQEIGATPIQVASAFGLVANGGERIRPHLVRELRSPDGTVLEKSEIFKERVLSPATTRSLTSMLESVTLKGTARLAQLNGYTAAGKTGTAQKIDPQTRTYSPNKYVASFVGFAPARKPSVVILVVIDEPVGGYYGGEVAAPVFREIAEQVLPFMNIQPDTELFSTPEQKLIATTTPNKEHTSSQPIRAHHRTSPTPAQITRSGEVVFAMATDRAIRMPDLSGLSVRDAYKVCSSYGLQLQAKGEGMAFRQSPGVGTSIQSGQTVQVLFHRRD
jgi:cell division protein FtsI (penicillin-binding protein 3)